MSTHNSATATLVSTDWMEAHIGRRSIAVVEINADPDSGYETGHIPGAVYWGLHTDLEDQIRRDIPGTSQFEYLLGKSGISNNATIVLYGDGNNRSATWAFWLLKYYRHLDVRILDGGRLKWVNEGRPLSMDIPAPKPCRYIAGKPDRSIRAMQNYILDNLGRDDFKILDTRTYQEHIGNSPTAQNSGASSIYRNGRIPGSIHIPWDCNIADDGTFKPLDQLRNIYKDNKLTQSDEVVSYCRLGIRASCSWFVLKYLLGYSEILNYDGSWTEWGNSTGVPIEIGVPNHSKSK